jgi:hypothetical protein
MIHSLVIRVPLHHPKLIAAVGDRREVAVDDRLLRFGLARDSPPGAKDVQAAFRQRRPGPAAER